MKAEMEMKMNTSFKILQIGLLQTLRDGILLILLPAPFLLGVIMKIGIPIVNTILIEKLNFTISPWYNLLDALLITMTPCLVSMICAFVMLEERDEGTMAYYSITPAAGYNYFIARIVLPMIWAFLCTILVKLLFGLTYCSIPKLLGLAVISSLHGAAIAMLLVTFAGNRVEGLALSKLVGVFLLGLPVVWFVAKPYQYFAAFLPSYWISRILVEPDSLALILLGIGVSLFWVILLTFLRFKSVSSC